MLILPYDENAISNHPLFKQSELNEALSRQPLSFIDVGARGGIHDIVVPIKRLTAVLGFEPDDLECERLSNIPEVASGWNQFILEPHALHNVEGKVTLHLISADTNHSLLSPDPEFIKRYNMQGKWSKIGEASLDAVTLDQVLENETYKESPVEWGEFIKLDTQGSEYEILQGAKKTITEKTVCIVSEVAFAQVYSNQKLFSELEILLRSFGFSFYGFGRIHTRSKKLLDKKTHVSSERYLYADAVFFKDPFQNELPFNKRQYVALITSAMLLGYFDFAMELIQSSPLSKDSFAVKLIEQLSMLSTSATAQAVTDLQKRIAHNPENANLLVGAFVDKRRQICDYDDAYNVSPLPTTF